MWLVFQCSPDTVTWMPSGDRQYPKRFFYRHMIPIENEAQYHSNNNLIAYAIQKASDGLAVLDLAALSQPFLYNLLRRFGCSRDV